jgi:hypothetical protein
MLKTNTKSHIFQKISTLFIGFTCILSFLNTNFAYAGSTQLGIEVELSNGIIFPTDVADENPNSTNHDKPLALNLTLPPTSSVDLTLVTDPQCVITPTSPITIPAGTTSVPFTVTAVNDGITETGTQTCLVTLSGVSSDVNYSGVLGSQYITILDYNPNIIFTPTGNLSENPASPNHTRSYLVTLQSQPTAPVILTIANTNNQVSISPTTITLDASNWNTGVLVSFTALTDGILESLVHLGFLTIVAKPTSAIEYRKVNNQYTLNIDDFNPIIVEIIRTGGQIGFQWWGSFLLLTMVAAYLKSQREEKKEKLSKN